MKKFLSVSLLAVATGLAGCASTGEGVNFNSIPGTEYLGPKSGGETALSKKMHLASAALAGGDHAAAVRMYREAARRHPNHIEPRLRLGEALLASHAPQEAARAFRGALNLSNKNVEARVGLGRAKLAIRQPADALTEFERALKVDKSSAIALNGKAVALDQLGQHAEAQSIYLKLLDQDPSNLKVRSNYGLSLALEGRSAHASDVLASLSAAPDAEPRIRQNLALAYGLAGNDGQAAHIARQDLDEDAVQNNLRYFARLRNMKSPIARGSVLSTPAKEAVSESFTDLEGEETSGASSSASHYAPTQEYADDADPAQEDVLTESLIPPHTEEDTLDQHSALPISPNTLSPAPVALLSVEGEYMPEIKAAPTQRVVTHSIRLPAVPSIPKEPVSMRMASADLAIEAAGRVASNRKLPAVPR